MPLRIKKTISIGGMTCTQCEKAIQRVLTSIEGVSGAAASFRTSSVEVVFDSLKASEAQLHQAIQNAGYEVRADRPAGTAPGRGNPGTLSPLQLAGVGVILVALYLMIDRTVGFNFIPQIKASMGYGMLFAVGLLTSIHCIAMCGGINLSQCLVRKPDGTSQAGWKPGVLYNAGRVISYTVVGGIVGALGSVVSLPGAARGLVAILAGLFMVVMGINMLGLIPGLRRLQIRMPAGIRNSLMGKSGERGPFIVGLLNGLMPCGPLQAMQLYALGTGSALSGALSMLVFSLGTVPLVFGFGAISTLLSRKFTRTVLRFSAALVIVLGLVMMQRGFSLGGLPVFGSSSGTQAKGLPVSTDGNAIGSVKSGNEPNRAGTAADTSGKPAIVGVSVENGVQVVKGEVGSRTYPAITVQKGMPVRFNLHAEARNLNGCNGTVIIPEFNIQKQLQPGDNVVEFTPDKAGTIGYTCWMGMVSSTITVVDQP